MVMASPETAPSMPRYPSLQMRVTPQHFVQWVDEEEAEQEVDETVVHVGAGEPKCLGHPCPEWDIRITHVGAHGMEAHEHGNMSVREVGDGISTMCCHQFLPRRGRP